MTSSKTISIAAISDLSHRHTWKIDGILTDVVIKSKQGAGELFCARQHLITGYFMVYSTLTLVPLHNNPYPGTDTLVDKLYRRVSGVTRCAENLRTNPEAEAGRPWYLDAEDLDDPIIHSRRRSCSKMECKANKTRISKTALRISDV